LGKVYEVSHVQRVGAGDGGWEPQWRFWRQVVFTYATMASGVGFDQRSARAGGSRAGQNERQWGDTGTGERLI